MRFVCWISKAVSCISLAFQTLSWLLYFILLDFDTVSSRAVWDLGATSQSRRAQEAIKTRGGYALRARARSQELHGGTSLCAESKKMKLGRLSFLPVFTADSGARLRRLSPHRRSPALHSLPLFTLSALFISLCLWSFLPFLFHLLLIWNKLNL